MTTTQVDATVASHLIREWYAKHNHDWLCRLEGLGDLVQEAILCRKHGKGAGLEGYMDQTIGCNRRSGGMSCSVLARPATVGPEERSSAESRNAWRMLLA